MYPASVTSWRTPTGASTACTCLQLTRDEPGDLHVKEDVGGLTGNLIGVVVLAGHHEFGALFADLLEDAIVATLKQLVGVAPFLRRRVDLQSPASAPCRHPLGEAACSPPSLRWSSSSKKQLRAPV